MSEIKRTFNELKIDIIKREIINVLNMAHEINDVELTYETLLQMYEKLIEERNKNEILKDKEDKNG